MKKVNIGLDLGITSVGWAVADENLTLIERGVRLFDSLDDNGELLNATRRDKRSMRRQVSRRKNLKKDFIKLLVRSKMVPDDFLDANNHLTISLENFGKKYSSNSTDENVIDLRIKAIYNKLSLDNLISVLYWYLSNRGFEYEVAGDDDFAKAQEAYGDLISDFKGKFVVEIQKAFFDKNGFFRSDLNRNFSTKQYLQELEAIFKNQDLPEEFKQAYLTLFKRRRKFEEGPGPKDLEVAKKMAKFPMHEGLFQRSKFQITNGEVTQLTSVWEKTIGKCSRYPGEDRAPKNSFAAEIFNLLNDLNNIYVYDANSRTSHKLDIQDKIAIINISLDTKSNINKVLSYITKKFSCDEESVLGFRIKNTKKNETEKLLTELATFHEIKKAFKNVNADFKVSKFTGDFGIFSFIDEIIEPCYKYKEVENRVEQFKKLEIFKSFTGEQLLGIAKTKIGSATHALSYKALHEYSKLLLNSEDNYSKLSYESRVEEQTNGLIKRKYIPLEWIDELIASPTIKRGIRQAMKVLNALIKTRDYEVQNIVIEMARETNDKQAKSSAKELQATLLGIRDQLREYIGEEQKASPDFKASKNIIQKLWLYKQQKGRDPYDGQLLPDAIAIMRNPNLVDIDHIIPYSQSFDDSRNNKVLTKKEHNAKKGNLTANQYIMQTFGLNKYNELFDLWKQMFIRNEPGFSSLQKFKNMTDDIDYSNPANAMGFIGRNLVDTRYIAKEVLAKLENFIKNQTDENHPWHNAGVKTINGKMTSFIGKLVEDGGKLIRPEGFENDGRLDPKTKLKVREWNGHHSEDAFLILHGALKNRRLNKYIEKVLSEPFMSDIEKEEFRKEMNEKYSQENNLDFEKKMDVDKIREDLNKSVNEVRFSYMTTSRSNRKFFNETFYTGRYDEEGNLHKVVKIKLQTADSKSLGEIFGDNFKYKVTMKEFDNNTFEALKKLYLQNLDQKEPFSKICDGKGRVSVSVGKNNTIRKVAHLTIIREEKSEIEVVRTKNNKNSFYESMEWIELRLYKNIKGQNKVIPVTAANHIISKGNVKPKEDVLKEWFKDKSIAYDAKPWAILKYGTIIKDLEGNLYRVNGQSHSQDKIELKRLDGLEVKKQVLYTLNSKIKEWKICEQNELGNIKEITPF